MSSTPAGQRGHQVHVRGQACYRLVRAQLLLSLWQCGGHTQLRYGETEANANLSGRARFGACHTQTEYDALFLVKLASNAIKTNHPTTYRHVRPNARRQSTDVRTASDQLV